MALISSSLTGSVFPPSAQALPGRIQNAYVRMNTDAIHPARGASADDIQNQLMKRQSTSNAFIDSLWDNPSNQDLVNGFLNNSFALTCARGSNEECLPLYQRYSVQDYFYLEDYVKYDALTLNTIPVGDLTTLQSQANAVASDAASAIQAGQAYVSELQGNASDLAEGNRNIPELAYGNVLQNLASKEDWFNMHVIVIPCVYGWGLLTTKLLNDPLTRTDTIFYNTWIVPNSNISYGNQLSAFLDANAMLWKDEIDTGNSTSVGQWNALFRTALKLETALFASAFDT